MSELTDNQKLLLWSLTIHAAASLVMEYPRSPRQSYVEQFGLRFREDLLFLRQKEQARDIKGGLTDVPDHLAVPRWMP